jgi:hypothetical protein
MPAVLRALLAGLALSLALAAAPAGAEVRWLCRPGLESDPCVGDLTTTYYARDGSPRVDSVDTLAAPPVDCFYVYPTVSNQPGPNATQTPDPEVRSIAVFQAQRFSSRCRIFAPLYRQVTAAGVSSASQTRDTAAYETAYSDVEEAFMAYLRSDNGGRGFVLIGHSQGSRMLRALIRRQIDPDPALRARMVSAIIPGANHVVAKGRASGGDFANLPECASAVQIGCVVSWHTFNDPPPDNARFGRTDTDPVGAALGLPTGPQYEVACTDPGALAAGRGRPLESLLPSEPFAPGVISVLLLRLYGGAQPTADTPWLSPADRYTARCETSNGANVLMLKPVGPARKLTPAPDPTWGVHLVDMNIGMGNLTTIVSAQSQAYARCLRLRTRAKAKLPAGCRRAR